MYRKYVKSGDLLEVYEFEREPPSGPVSVKPRRKRVIRERTEANIRAARRSFKRLVRANLGGTEKPALMTLTFAENVKDIAVANRAYTLFTKRLRTRYGRDLRFISVPEFQKRGAVHYHVLVWGLSHETIKSERRTRAVARLWGGGYADLVATDGDPRISSYLAKYMSKAMHDYRLVGKRAYSASRNCMRPSSVSSRWPLAESLTLADWGYPQARQEGEAKEYDTLFLGRCLYKQFILT